MPTMGESSTTAGSVSAAVMPGEVILTCIFSVGGASTVLLGRVSASSLVPLRLRRGPESGGAGADFFVGIDGTSFESCTQVSIMKADSTAAR